MDPAAFETRRAFHDLLDVLKGLDEKFFEGPSALQEYGDVLDGYPWITTILRVALDAWLYADPSNPRFVEIVGPDKKWGGDNADAFYVLAGVDGSRRYRVRGRKGDAVYLSLTVYGGTPDGSYAAQRTVGTLNHRDMEFADDGSFEILLSADEQPEPAGSWLKLDPDSLFVITRDYMTDAANGQRAEWTIETEGPISPPRPDDAALARRYRAVTRFIQDQASFQPIPFPEPNTVQEPGPAASSFGWNAGDAMYAMGSFQLEDDLALVIRGRSPGCVFWNVCLWNAFLHSYDYRTERVSLNGAQCQYERDGSFTLVVSPRDPGHPNWISTAGRRRGLIWFRWFLADEVPKPLQVELIPLTSV